VENLFVSVDSYNRVIINVMAALNAFEALLAASQVPEGGAERADLREELKRSRGEEPQGQTAQPREMFSCFHGLPAVKLLAGCNSVPVVGRMNIDDGRGGKFVVLPVGVAECALEQYYVHHDAKAGAEAIRSTTLQFLFDQVKMLGAPYPLAVESGSIVALFPREQLTAVFGGECPDLVDKAFKILNIVIDQESGLKAEWRRGFALQGYGSKEIRFLAALTVINKSGRVRGGSALGSQVDVSALGSRLDFLEEFYKVNEVKTPEQLSKPGEGAGSSRDFTSIIQGASAAHSWSMTEQSGAMELVKTGNWFGHNVKVIPSVQHRLLRAVRNSASSSGFAEVYTDIVVQQVREAFPKAINTAIKTFLQVEVTEANARLSFMQLVGKTSSDEVSFEDIQNGVDAMVYISRASGMTLYDDLGFAVVSVRRKVAVLPGMMTGDSWGIILRTVIIKHIVNVARRINRNTAAIEPQAARAGVLEGEPLEELSAYIFCSKECYPGSRGTE
jgi:hypothetical protein